jgi:hypothetical protein
MVLVTLRLEHGEMVGVYSFVIVPRISEMIRVNRKYYRVTDALHEPGNGVTLTVSWAGDVPP